MAALPHRPRRPSRIGRVLRTSLKLAGAGVVLALTVGLVLGWTSFGKRADGARRARMAASPEWRQDHFVEPAADHQRRARDACGGCFAAARPRARSARFPS